MLRKSLGFAPAVALVILLCAIIYQRERIERLKAMLQERTQHEAVLREQRDHAGTSAESDNSQLNPSGSATLDQSRELLRLRGEVSVLKRQLAEVVDQASNAQARQQPMQNQTGSWTEADLTDQQRKSLADWTEKLRTGNSVADLPKLRDSLERWDELFINPAPPDQKPVFAVLKERVRQRIAELENER